MVTVCGINKECEVLLNRLSQLWFAEATSGACNNEASAFLTHTIYEQCEECRKMAALPHGAFAACKLRHNSDKSDSKLARIQTTEKQQEIPHNYSKKLMEYTPAKYNGKLMNSIWSHYNRYSPHNIKSNDDDNNYYFLNQQHYNAAGLAKSTKWNGLGKMGDEWKFPSPKK